MENLMFLWFNGTPDPVRPFDSGFYIGVLLLLLMIVMDMEDQIK